MNSAAPLRAIGLTTACALGVFGCASDPPWNVLLVTFDTTRADHLGPYGHPDARTPTIDRLAAEGILFERAQTAVPITCPSHSTIMTGTYPLYHGVRDNSHYVLPQERTTLAEILRQAGYSTGAAVGAFPLLARYGLDQGFDFYDDRVAQPYEDFRGQRIASTRKLFFDERPAGLVNESLLPWLRRNLDRPFFAWLHYFDPHQPLQPPPPYDQIFAGNPYLGEIAYADESLGRVIAELEAAGVAERTVIVFTADHGEGRGEHDEATHALLNYETTLRVPLIIKIPGRRGGLRISQRVGTVDIVPTILELLDLEAPAEVQGRSLLALLTGGEPDPAAGRLYYAETLAPRLMHGWGELRTIYQGPRKYIHGPRTELYDVVADPGEHRNLFAEQPQQAAILEGQLADLLRTLEGDTSAAVQETDAETIERLAALGYLSSRGKRPPFGPETLKTDGQPPQDHVGDITLMGQVKGLLHQMRYREAKDAARRLLQREPTSPFHLGLLAWALAGLGQNKEAMDLLDGVEEPIAYMRHVYNMVGLEAFRDGDRERGMSLVRRMNEAHESAEGFYILAAMHEELGDSRAQLEALEQSLERDQSFVPARLNVAILLARDGRLEDAELEMRRALEDSPLYPLAHFNYGRLLGELGRDEDALGHLRRSVELDPRYWEAELARIALLLDLDRHTEATAIEERLRRDCADQTVLRRAAMLLESR
jgi:arylsulfatase A-like enzyme/Flp pilus assembly protein TadD